MRIRYDNKKNYFKHYNISQGIIQSKGEIINNPQNKVSGYIGKGIYFLIFILLIFLASKILKHFFTNKIIFNVISISSVVFLVLTALYFLMFIFGYLSEIKKSKSGQLIIDKEGIKCLTDDGIMTGVKWEKILGVVIINSTITIITSSPFFFFVDISLKDKLLTTINDYKKNIKVIDKINS